MRRKIVLGCIFVAVVLLTVLLVAYLIIAPKEPVDDTFGNSMDMGITLFILTPILLVEFNIYRFFVYFLTEKKACWKTIFNIVMMITSLFLILTSLNCFFDLFDNFFDSFFGIIGIDNRYTVKYIESLWFIDVAVMVVLRFIYYLCCTFINQKDS